MQAESSKIVVNEFENTPCSPEDNSSATENTSKQTTGASETVDIPETAMECEEPSKTEVNAVAVNNTARKIWDAHDYI